MWIHIVHSYHAYGWAVHSYYPYEGGIHSYHTHHSFLSHTWRSHSFISHASFIHITRMNWLNLLLIWMDWFWWLGWLNNKGALCSLILEFWYKVLISLGSASPIRKTTNKISMKNLKQKSVYWILSNIWIDWSYHSYELNRITHLNCQDTRTKDRCDHTSVSCAVATRSMGWLRLVRSLKSLVSFAEYRLFYKALMQKRPVIWRSLLIRI